MAVDYKRIRVRRGTLGDFIAAGFIPEDGEPIAIIGADGKSSGYKIGNGVDAVDKLPALSKGDAGPQGNPGVKGDPGGAFTYASPGIYSAAGAVSIPALTGNSLEYLQQQRARALQSWWFALANRDYAPAVARFGPGDSITEGQGATTRDRRWVQRAQMLLRRHFPTTALGSGGGVGWIDPWQMANSFGQPATVGGNLPANPGGGGSYTDTGFGLSRRTYILKASTDTWTITVKGTSVDIHGVQVNGATATITVDGGTPQTISFGGSGVSDGKVIRVTLGASGGHTITLAGASGSFYFSGIYVNDGDENQGVHTYGNGYYGQSTTFFANLDAPKPIAAIQPSLFVIALSINDYAANASAATAKQNLQKIIAACKANVTTPPSFVLMPYWLRTGTFTGDAWSAFVAAQYEIAAADPSVCVLDLNARMPAANGPAANPYYTDGIHPTDMSHAFIADQLVRFLSPM
ncbi:SGNH/GDSL hydrolase family protein [Curtobacterium citreum]|uniref:SGNH/GDSL hydrolase family protein n=1 Tax=Curtobacterium citreum TaxID=2036 RepID=A0ABT2HDR6_9MICO|nr:SGNH/GDSL hydrolase family protein [Curtobacterium citreum]MCS6521333.1 SGNH/GDSL hydrolase family protein [Curtobacterium citreum]TQJ28192.1 GDSL-like lipase/acylhydrolase family protein [Curtobacterium citreum]